MNLDMLENIRKNHFCVISKKTYGEYETHIIQTNSSWSENPYGETYAVVPDDMVQDILATKGFCNITLNDDGTEVVSFVAREIPELPEPTPEPTSGSSDIDDLASAILEGVNEV